MLELNFSPFPVISTNRLLLDVVQSRHAADILLLRSDEKVMQYIARDRAKNLEDAEAFIKIVEEGITKNEAITWRISLKENPDKLIGNIGLWRILKQHYRAEIGYMISPEYWGKGLMQEAIEAVIDFGFTQLQLHSIEAHVDALNAASAGILEKNNFIREGYFKEDFFFAGKFRDTIIYSLLNKK
jgi:ribosomal-protein-alanine N-acetyltransferase